MKLEDITPELKEGELVLIKTTQNSHALGTFSDGNEKRIFLHQPSYYLGKPVNLDGKIKLEVSPGIDSRSYSQIGQIYRGKKEIVKYLESHPDLKGHADWVKKLDAPFELPKTDVLRTLRL
ncbi:MAG: hypothetical protein WCK29_02245 [archaeon]